MAREFAQPLYNSRQWKECRDAYMSQVNYICERCGNAAAVVHHKKYVTEDNVNDPCVTLNPENFEALCYECHEKEHSRNRRRAVLSKFDEQGNPIDMKQCTVVCGAPGSGKTTFVREALEWGDLLLDLDYINAALLGDLEHVYKDPTTVLPVSLQLRDTIYACIVKHIGRWKHAYVITAQGNMYAVKDLAERLNADIHVIDTSKDECIRRVKNDFRRRNKLNKFTELIGKWFDEYEKTKSALPDRHPPLDQKK